MTQDIQNIRDQIQAFEEVKNAIIDFLNTQRTLDESRRRIWISDIKEAYYSVVAAWQMLDSAVRGDKKHADSSQRFLDAARSRVAQCLSELRSIDARRAGGLETSLQQAFQACHTAIAAGLEPYTEARPPNPPKKRIVNIAPHTYQLPCSVCGEIAASFTFEKGAEESEVTYQGITHRTSLNLSMRNALLNSLKHDDIAGIHRLVKQQKSMEDGLDAYCPECDKIYCKTHYQVTAEWDEGFYDCSYGTCPEGHRRIIDD